MRVLVPRAAARAAKSGPERLPVAASCRTTFSPKCECDGRLTRLGGTEADDPTSATENRPDMRKTPLIMLGVAAGMALTFVATQSYVALGGTDPRALAAPTNYRLLDVFGDAYEQVRKHYVEKPNDKDLMGTAINGMLASLEDSYYVDAKTLQNSQACTAHCDFGDIGIAFTMVDGYAKIISAIDDSPAAKAGIMAGDII